MKTINLPRFGIDIILADNGGGVLSSDVKEGCPCCGSARCFFDCGQSRAAESPEAREDARRRLEFNSRIDGIEALILATACAGIDVTAGPFIKAIQTAVDATGNQD